MYYLYRKKLGRSYRRAHVITAMTRSVPSMLFVTLSAAVATTSTNCDALKRSSAKCALASVQKFREKCD